MGLSLIRSHKYKTAFKNNTPPSPPPVCLQGQMAQGAASGTALWAIHYNFRKISSQVQSKGKQTENQFQKNIRKNYSPHQIL